MSEPRPPALTPAQLARWAWRQLTSMRVALVLLFLLALAAVPGSLLPQRAVDPVAVAEFRREHPGLAPWLDRLSLFDVFSSPWFSAVYLLLFLSLLGCLVPRSRQYWRALRSQPSAPPRNFGRLPGQRRFETDAPLAAVLAAAEAALRRERFRLATHDAAVSAEKGYLRETGNLLFHFALLFVLVGVAIGHLYGFKGSALVVEGEGFANTVTQYDNVQFGGRYDAGRLPPFAFRFEDFRATYEEEGPQRGAARDFTATLSVRPRPGAQPRTVHVRVNHPLEVDGIKVFLGSHGYAPVVTVRDGSGQVVFAGPVPFLPTDPVRLTSSGVVKVPDARPAQLGFQGFFLPTAAFDTVHGPVSTFPEPRNPRLVLNAWQGDLGLDSGFPQSVYRLDTDKLTLIRKADGQPLAESLTVGQTMTLPGGLGSLTFDGYREWVVFQMAHDPGKGLSLAGAGLALAGVLLSLFVRPRRVWVRADVSDGGRTVVRVGALARSDAPSRSPGAEDDVERVVAAIRSAEPAPAVSPEAVSPEEETVRVSEEG
jgi:cytochrome c biogenesis protein